jgi:hypothetical protein
LTDEEQAIADSMFPSPEVAKEKTINETHAIYNNRLNAIRN